MPSLSGSWSWCVATLCWSKGNGEMALERKLERHRAQPCLPAQQHSPVSSTGRSQQPSSLLSFVLPQACVPATVNIWVALGSLGCGGRGGLSPWARMSPGRCQEFPVPLFCPGRRLGAADLLADSGNPNRTRMEAGCFSDLFVPTDGCVYRQTEQSCSFLRGHSGKRDMCATLYH